MEEVPRTIGLESFQLKISRKVRIFPSRPPPELRRESSGARSHVLGDLTHRFDRSCRSVTAVRQLSGEDDDECVVSVRQTNGLGRFVMGDHSPRGQDSERGHQHSGNQFACLRRHWKISVYMPWENHALPPRISSGNHICRGFDRWQNLQLL